MLKFTLTLDQANTIRDALWSVDAHLDPKSGQAVTRGKAQAITRKAIKVLDKAFLRYARLDAEAARTMGGS